MLATHRVSWELANGRPVPVGMCVCHRCDVRACVNPAHLFLGTYADNLADMRQKRRGARETTNGVKRLTDAEVVEIKRLRASGISQNKVAAQFGVSQSLISRIDSGERRAS